MKATLFSDLTLKVDDVEPRDCDKCGGSCIRTLTVGPDGSPIQEFNGTRVTITGGYDCEYLGDGMKYQFDLCEKCCYEIMKTLKHEPLVTDTFFDDEITEFHESLSERNPDFLPTKE